MNLLLTSSGFKNTKVVEIFIGLVKKPLDQLSVVFIPTASRTPEELRYVELSKQELYELGILDIKILNLDHKLSSDELLHADVIYVCGGNTRYLMNKMKESGLDVLIKKFEGIYVGVSAGSIVAGPDIEISTVFHESDSGTDTKGLGLVDFAVTPHYQMKEKTIIDEFKKTVTYDVIELTDNQAALVYEGNTTIIGEP